MLVPKATLIQNSVRNTLVGTAPYAFTVPMEPQTMNHILMRWILRCLALSLVVLLTACVSGQEGTECDETADCDDELQCLQGFSRDNGECEFHDLGMCRMVCEDDEICEDFFGTDDAICMGAACGPDYCMESSPFD